MIIEDRVQKTWRYLAVAGTMAICLGVGVFIVETLPPRTIVMATGIEGGANYELGIRYREILAKAGVNLQLMPTTGGMENLVRLRDPKSGVSVGFIQGGTTTKKESPELESLGTVFYETDKGTVREIKEWQAIMDHLRSLPVKRPGELPMIPVDERAAEIRAIKVS
jgi:hypothetical protein